MWLIRLLSIFVFLLPLLVSSAPLPHARAAASDVTSLQRPLDDSSSEASRTLDALTRASTAHPGDRWPYAFSSLSVKEVEKLAAAAGETASALTTTSSLAEKDDGPISQPTPSTPSSSPEPSPSSVRNPGDDCSLWPPNTVFRILAWILIALTVCSVIGVFALVVVFTYGQKPSEGVIVLDEEEERLLRYQPELARHEELLCRSPSPLSSY